VAGNPNLVMVSGGPQHNLYGQNLQYDNSGKRTHGNAVWIF
jgi:hypothetical protein